MAEGAAAGGLEQGRRGGSSGSSRAEPRHELSESADGSGYTLVVHLPAERSMKQVDLSVSEDELVLQSPSARWGRVDSAGWLVHEVLT